MTDLRAAALRLGTAVLFGLYPLALLATLIVRLAHGDHAPGEPPVMDFHTFWLAGGAYLHGLNPYPHVETLTAFTTQAQQSFVYPAPMAAFFAVFALLPFAAAGTIYVAVSLLSVAAGLWLLEVRDWRVYGLAFAIPPVLSGVHIGSLSPLLFLGAAAAWRYRRTPWVCGLAVAAIVVAKLFLWPLLLWLLVTRRYRALVWAVGSSVVATLIAWAPLGFAGFGSYPQLLRRIGELAGPSTYQAAWAAPEAASTLLLLAAFAGAALYLRTGRGLGDRTGFQLALLLSLALSPIVWLHYFVLLFAVFALAGRRLSPLWLTTLVFIPAAHIDSLWRAGIGSAVIGVALVAVSTRGRATRETDARGPARLAPVVVE